MKVAILTAAGAVGAVVAGLLGGWDAGIQSLCLFMLVDYLTGLIVAGVFLSSPKTSRGALESRTAWLGLLRKGASLGVVMIACRLDLMFATNMIRDGTVIAYSLNELLSIVENLGLMGVPLPRQVKRAIEVLKEQSE
ncbi:MAG: holin family protein [Eubacteriaceae bacterium]